MPLIFILFSLLLTGCGQKGPLYPPDAPSGDNKTRLHVEL
jgi:predicted small lipoprotein YifL